MVVNYNMVVDFARPSKSNTILIAENDANSRNCRFTLLFDKAPFDMTGVTTATVMAITQGGGRIYGDATIEEDEEGNLINELTYLLPPSMSESAGTVTATITLADELGARITSFEFFIKVRNALYNEDDYIDDDDLSGFRELLNRTKAALEKMEEMTEQDALPNPYPLRISVDNVDYEYNGSELVEILMEEVAYLGDISGTVEITEDESAAAIAVRSAEEAAASEAAAAQIQEDLQALQQHVDETKDEILAITSDFTSKIPLATVTKDEETHTSLIQITDQNGTTSAEVEDGVIGNRWYFGTSVSGGSSTPASFTTGIPYAYENDGYVNTSEGAVYTCTTPGDETEAEWAYVFTMSSSGGGGTSNYADLSNKPKINNHELTGNSSLADLGITAAITSGVTSAISTKADLEDLDEYTTSQLCYTDNSSVKVAFDNLNKSYGYQLYYDDQDSAFPTNGIPMQKGDPVKSSGTTSGTIKLTYTLTNAVSGSHKFALRILK